MNIANKKSCTTCLNSDKYSNLTAFAIWPGIIYEFSHGLEFEMLELLQFFFLLMTIQKWSNFPRDK